MLKHFKYNIFHRNDCIISKKQTNHVLPFSLKGNDSRLKWAAEYQKKIMTMYTQTKIQMKIADTESHNKAELQTLVLSKKLT